MRRVVLLASLLLIGNGCSLSYFAQVEEQSYESISCAPESKSGESRATIYINSLGWHTGIVVSHVQAEEALGDVIPELHTYNWVEIGWGDRDFYMASNYTYWAAFRASFFSTASVLHVAAFSEKPEIFFDRYQLFRITIPEKKLTELFSYIREHLALSADGQSTRLGNSLYGKGSFYAGLGSFSRSNTCNSWTAAALVRAGCNIDPDLTRASTLIRELRSLDN